MMVIRFIKMDIFPLLLLIHGPIATNLYSHLATEVSTCYNIALTQQ